jgi:hypothetical protein
MTGFVIYPSIDGIKEVKGYLRDCFPNVKSSHLSEALAAALGYRTHAALLADIKSGNAAHRRVLKIDEKSFIKRAHELNFNAPHGCFEQYIPF